MEQELFILWSPDTSLYPEQYSFEGDTRMDAEAIARAQRGVRVFVLRSVACVQEPLPPLVWSDGQPGGDGLRRGIALTDYSLGAKMQAPQTLGTYDGPPEGVNTVGGMR